MSQCPIFDPEQWGFKRYLHYLDLGEQFLNLLGKYTKLWLEKKSTVDIYLIYVSMHLVQHLEHNKYVYFLIMIMMVLTGGGKVTILHFPQKKIIDEHC